MFICARENTIVGLNGYVHKDKGRGTGTFYAWDQSLPNEETTFYDYPWLESCERNGTATYGLLIPIILVKILAAFVVYRRAYAEHDTWRAKVAGVAVEAGCFVALLGITIEFYATCWRALPNRGTRIGEHAALVVEEGRGEAGGRRLHPRRDVVRRQAVDELRRVAAAHGQHGAVHRLALRVVRATRRRRRR